MRLRRLTTFLFCLAGISTVSAANPDSLPIYRRIIRDATPAGALPDFVLRNPAALWFRQDFSYSELSVGYEDAHRGSAALQQEGTGGSGIGFRARSFVVTSKQGRAFGEAGYSNDTKRDVRWSETSDFALLYPYLTADSVGGDLASETYWFSGGYAHSLGAWSWAARLDYRALLEYRKVDPRPRNVVSDLQGSLAAARNVGPDYRLSLAAYGRKYSQSGSIDFYNEMNDVPVIHLTGLGMDYVRFAGANTSTFYSGGGGGGSIDLFPSSRKGFSASVGYHYFAFAKELRDKNNLPLARLADHALTAMADYRTEGDALSYGVTAEGNYRKRTGTENVFGDPLGNSYPLIGGAEQYHNRIITATLSGFVGSRNDARVVWWVQPTASFVDFEATYPAALRRMRFSRWQGGADGAVLYPLGRWLLTVRGGIAYSGKVQSELALPALDPQQSRTAMLQANYRYLTDDFTRVQLSLQVNYRFAKERTVFLKAGWSHDQFRTCGTANGMEIRLGFGF